MKFKGGEKELHKLLQRIDGRGYKAYKGLEGSYELGRFLLNVDHVQGDPYAAPSRLSLQLSHGFADLPRECLENRIRRIATADFLGRSFARAIGDIARGNRGSGRSGLIQIDSGRQEVLERNSVLVGKETIEVRFSLGLPARGRKVLGRQAAEMICNEVPAIAERSLLGDSLDTTALLTHVKTIEDQRALRDQLVDQGLVAFVADGALLPRRSGVDDRPLEPGEEGLPVVPFTSPPVLRCELQRPNGGPISGMGIPRGVTLIVGGGYHGKSTLLRAVERGVYDHLPGDGREGVVSLPDALKVRAEDGRSVQGVDLTPFINRLPFQDSTRRFSTANASGSTSQAAHILEGLEIGSRLLLIDEDTSATNFIIRDARMQALVESDREPITPFVDRVRELFRDFDVSTVMVMGGSGDYFDSADLVIMMHEYAPYDVTERAKEVVRDHPSRRRNEVEGAMARAAPRMPVAGSMDPSRGKRSVKVGAPDLRTIRFGTETIDLSALEQLADESQTRAIAEALVYLKAEFENSSGSLREALGRLNGELDDRGLDLLTPFKTGNLARPRLHEIAAALNRLRTLRVK